MRLEATNDVRLAVEHLVDDALDGKELTFPLPINRPDIPLDQIEGYAVPRRLNSAQLKAATNQVALLRPEALIPAHRTYLAGLLEDVAGLCLAKAARLTGSSPQSTDHTLERMKEFIQKANLTA